MVVPYPGDWILRLQIRTSEIDESDIDVPLKIR
jgi:copper transport protein